MWTENPRHPRAVTTETCTDVQRELDRSDPGGGGDPPDGNPGDGDDDPRDNCGVNPNDPTCPVDCEYNPLHPDCEEETVTVCEEWPQGVWTCTEYAFSPGSSGGGSTTVSGSGGRAYRITLSAEADVSVSLTGMNRDIDCSVNGESCTNHWGTRDDSWSGRLGAATHTVSVYPYRYSHGSWTVTISATGVRVASPPGPPPTRTDPPTTPVPATRALPFTASEQGAGEQSYEFTLSEETRVSVSLTGMDRDIDCRVNGSSCTNRGGTQDDSWSGRLAAGSHTVTVYPYNYPTGSWTVSVAASGVRVGTPPGPPPTRTDPPTTPVPATRALPFTVSEQGVTGAQSYDFSLSSEVRVDVSLTGMDRDIDCRVGSSSCTNHGGTRDDSWSGTLAAGRHTVTVYPYGGGSGSYTLSVSRNGTTPAPPPTTPDPPTPEPPTPEPPRLSLPAIPDFPNLPAGASIDTVFPAATGGTPPYVYSVSGLPPGIAFDPAARRASGRLPTVSVYTNYTVFYYVNDSNGWGASQIFTAGVRP